MYLFEKFSVGLGKEQFLWKSIHGKNVLYFTVLYFKIKDC
jgi:hypothetical protein